MELRALAGSRTMKRNLPSHASCQPRWSNGGTGLLGGGDKPRQKAAVRFSTFSKKDLSHEGWTNDPEQNASPQCGDISYGMPPIYIPPRHLLTKLMGKIFISRLSLDSRAQKRVIDKIGHEGIHFELRGTLDSRSVAHWTLLDGCLRIVENLACSPGALGLHEIQ